MTDPDEATPSVACRTCPWRIENHGKRHPDGWFTAAKRAFLWARLRRGEPMSCHRTDPANPVSDAAVAAGYKRVPEGTQPRECTGATVLVQREVMVWQNRFGCDTSRYRRRRPRGLTRDGLAAVVMRATFGGLPLVGAGPEMDRPNLNAEGISAGNGLDWLPADAGEEP